MANRKLSVKDKTAAAVFAVVLGISSVLGVTQRENAAGQKGAYVRAEDGAASVKETPAASVAPDPETAAPLETLAPVLPVLNREQAALAGSIMESLKEGNQEQAAQMMAQEEDALQEMFYTTMKGQRYFYDGDKLTSLTEETNGQGMVLTKPSTVFYGSFREGKPDGSCTALQAVDLGAPRYDYAEGVWKDGKMNGAGRTGYCYYEKSPDGEAQDICKSGTFSEDFLDGEVVYTSTNQEGETAVWKLTVDHGTVVLDDRWEYMEETGEYQLLSEEDSSYGYVAGEDQITQPVWKNLLVWDE